MQNTVNTRTNRYGIDLNSIKPYPANRNYVAEVIAKLQETKQNLSTKDLISLFMDDLARSGEELYRNNFELCLLGNISYYPHNLTMNDDKLALYVLIYSYLSDAQLRDAYYQNLLILHADLPSKSTLNPKKLAVWRNTSKMGNIQTRQAVSVRKWIGSTLVGLDSEQQENLAKLIDRHLQGDMLDKLDVRFAASSQFNLWRDAYESDKIRSCMHPQSNCKVGQERTYRSYCTQHYGLPDNGLQLAVLYQDDAPVARSITFSDGDSKYFVSSYGDDRLYKWLKANGYNQTDGYPEGTILYAGEKYMKPYVDGNVTKADYHYDTEANTYYWRLCECDGEYELQNTDAYANENKECELCHDRFHADDMYHVESAVNGFNYHVCEDCREENTWQVYTGGRHTDRVFFHDGMRPDTNSDYVEYEGDYYHEDSLSEYDLRLIDDTVYHNDDLYYCDVTDKYLTRDEVYTDADDIPTDKPVYFPYDCVSKEYWHDNVVECTCGTLALAQDTKKLGKPSLGDVVTLDLYWGVLQTTDTRGDSVLEFIFHLDVIERDYNYDPSDEMKAFMDYAIAYNKIQYLRFQELGI